jgi:hypothetical protein
MERQREWIWDAAQELTQATPPAPSTDRDGRGPSWIVPGFLTFSNGWAAYKVHTLHDGEDIGDTTVLRTSDGALYLSKTHFCTGIRDLMLPRDDPGHTPRPADMKDFIERYAKYQGWNLFAPGSRLWCLVNNQGFTDSRNHKEALWVWIGSSEKSEHGTLFKRCYQVTGTYVTWTTSWLPNGEIRVDVFDYGPGTTPFMGLGNPDRLQSNHLASIGLHRDGDAGIFTDKN